MTPRPHASTLPRFCAIGAFGFAVDATLLQLLIDLFAVPALAARLVSILVAVTTTWALHRPYTFRSADPDRLAEWSRFAAVNAIGAALNFAVFAAVLAVAPATPPLAALAAGSAIALAANYLGSRLFAFRAAA